MAYDSGPFSSLVCFVTMLCYNALCMLDCVTPLHFGEACFRKQLRLQANWCTVALVQSCKMIIMAAVMASINVILSVQSWETASLKTWMAKGFSV